MRYDVHNLPIETTSMRTLVSRATTPPRVIKRRRLAMVDRITAIGRTHRSTVAPSASTWRETALFVVRRWVRSSRWPVVEFRDGKAWANANSQGAKYIRMPSSFMEIQEAMIADKSL